MTYDDLTTEKTMLDPAVGHVGYPAVLSLSVGEGAAAGAGGGAFHGRIGGMDINDIFFGPIKMPADLSACTSASGVVPQPITLESLIALVDSLPPPPPPPDKHHCTNCGAELSEITSDPFYAGAGPLASVAGYFCPTCTMRFRRLAMKDKIAADAKRLRELARAHLTPPSAASPPPR